MNHTLLILKTQRYIIERIDEMAASIADLDAAISSLEQAETTAAQTITTALNDLIAKVAPTGVDVSAEVSRIQAVATSLGTLAGTASTDDPGAATPAA